MSSTDRFPVLKSLGILLLLVSAWSGEAFAADVIGFVDIRQLYLAHPLMRQFDSETRRFRDTASAYVENPEKARAEYQRQIGKMQAQDKDLEKRFAATFKITDPAQKKAETDRIWLEKNEIKTKIANLQQAIEATKVYGNYLHSAATGVESIIPLIRKIVQDIDLVVRQLSVRNGNIQILDLACVFPNGDQGVCDRSILFQNAQYSIWSARPDPRLLSSWLGQVRLHLRDRWPERFGTPFLVGFKDLRQDAVQLLLGSSK